METQKWYFTERLNILNLNKITKMQCYQHLKYYLAECFNHSSHKSQSSLFYKQMETHWILFGLVWSIHYESERRTQVSCLFTQRNYFKVRCHYCFDRQPNYTQLTVQTLSVRTCKVFFTDIPTMSFKHITVMCY